MSESAKSIEYGEWGISGVVSAESLEVSEQSHVHESSHSGMSLGALSQPGKLVEISGDGASARMTTAVAIVRQAQFEGETTAWIQPTSGPLFPPDLAASGIDLASLVVVHIDPKHGRRGLPRAAEILLRSGAFGLIVLDLSTQSCGKPAWQARLQGLARLHHSRLVALTRKRDHQDSLGPLVNLRVSPTRTPRHTPPQTTQTGAFDGFDVLPRLLKDKSGHQNSLPPCPRRGPWGLG